MDDNDSSIEELSQENAGEAERIAEEAATLNKTAKKKRKEDRRVKRAAKEAKDLAIKRTKKRELKEKKDKAKRDSLLTSIDNEVHIVSSEDSTSEGDEGEQKKNKLSNLKMVATVEEETIRYDPKSTCITDTNLYSYRQDKLKAKKRKRRNPNYSNLFGKPLTHYQGSQYQHYYLCFTTDKKRLSWVPLPRSNLVKVGNCTQLKHIHNIHPVDPVIKRSHYYNYCLYKPSTIITRSLQRSTKYLIPQRASINSWTREARARGRSSAQASMCLGFVHITTQTTNSTISNSYICRSSYKGQQPRQLCRLGKDSTQDSVDSGQSNWGGQYPTYQRRGRGGRGRGGQGY